MEKQLIERKDVDKLFLKMPSDRDFPQLLDGLEASAEIDDEPFLMHDKIKESYEQSPAQYFARLNDLKGGWEFKQKDGTVRTGLPQITRWSFIDEVMVGTINLRWQNGTNELPEYVIGHIGYQIFPKYRGLGLATQQLTLMKELAKEVGLDLLYISHRIENLASQKVILRNGGIFIEDITVLPEHGGWKGKSYKIPL